MDTAADPPAPFFHADSDALRFWVELPGRPPMGAIIGRRVLQQCFQGREDGSDALSVYAQNRRTIHAAVARRAAAGSLEPVMLREFDMRLSERPPR
jgi:hypothetical protein